MRLIRDISKVENFRTDPASEKVAFIKRDFVKPEPEGTIILLPFRITGYDLDCDGSALAQLKALDNRLDTTGWRPNGIGLYPDVGFVVDKNEFEDTVKALSFQTNPCISCDQYSVSKCGPDCEPCNKKKDYLKSKEI